jgi:hypothetical protein
MGRHSKRHEACTCVTQVESGRAYPVSVESLPVWWIADAEPVWWLVWDVALVLMDHDLPEIQPGDPDYLALLRVVCRYAFALSWELGTGECPCLEAVEDDRAYPMKLPPCHTSDEGFMGRLVEAVGEVLAEHGLPVVEEDSADYYALMWTLYRWCFGLPAAVPGCSGTCGFSGGSECGGA